MGILLFILDEIQEHLVQHLVAQMVKTPPAMKETQVWSLGWEDPLEKSMATHSSLLVWRIPWTEEPGGLQSVKLQRVRHDWASNSFTFTSFYKWNLDLVLWRWPQLCFTCLNSLLHSVYLWFSMWSLQTRCFIIDMSELVSVFWVSVADPDLFPITWADHLGSPLWLGPCLSSSVQSCGSDCSPASWRHVELGFLSLHCHHLCLGPTVPFLASCSIFTMYSLPSISPSWFCGKWLR